MATARRRRWRGALAQILAFSSWLRGDLVGAAGHGADTFARFKALGDPEGMAWSLLNRAAAAYTRASSPARASSLARRSASPARRATGRIGVGPQPARLVRCCERRVDQAAALLRRSLELHRDRGPLRMARVLEALAAVARARGDLRGRSARRRRGGAAVALGTPLPPVRSQDWEAERSAAAATLGRGVRRNVTKAPTATGATRRLRAQRRWPAVSGQRRTRRVRAQPLDRFDPSPLRLGRVAGVLAGRWRRRCLLLVDSPLQHSPSTARGRRGRQRSSPAWRCGGSTEALSIYWTACLHARRLSLLRPFDGV